MTEDKKKQDFIEIFLCVFAPEYFSEKTDYRNTIAVDQQDIVEIMERYHYWHCQAERRKAIIINDEVFVKGKDKVGNKEDITNYFVGDIYNPMGRSGSYLVASDNNDRYHFEEGENVVIFDEDYNQIYPELPEEEFPEVE